MAGFPFPPKDGKDMKGGKAPPFTKGKKPAPKGKKKC
jgi:hypothetical protein